MHVERPDGSVRFYRAQAPTSAEFTGLARHVEERIGRYLERQRLLERDAENSYLAGAAAEAV